jgi:hypothetical protein
MLGNKNKICFPENEILDIYKDKKILTQKCVCHVCQE